MTRSRRSAASMLIAALAMLGALTACSGDAGADDARTLRDGPLTVSPPHAWAISQPAGTTFTDGLEILSFTGTTPARIVDVRLVGDPAMQLVGVGLADPTRRYGSIQLMDHFPPTHPELDPGSVIANAKSASMAPDTRDNIGWELLLGIRVTEPGRHVRTGVEVTYDVGPERYVEVLPAALAVCVPEPGTEPAECRTPPLPRP